MANSTFTTIAQIIANKLNLLIQRINILTTEKADKNGTQFTGNVSIVSGATFDINGITYPTNDGTVGQGLLTDGNGNVSFGNVNTVSTTNLVTTLLSVLKTNTFTGDGIQNVYGTSTTLTGILFVEINGLIQQETVNYVVGSNSISFTTTPNNGDVITIKYF